MSDPNEPQYPQAPPSSPWPPSSPASPPPSPPTPGEVPWVAPTPSPAPVTRRPPVGRIVAVGVGVLAVGGGAVFAASALQSDSGGAATPEEAGARLVEAVANEDVLGVVDLLPAGERELLRDVTIGVRDEYQRLGVLSDQFTLEGFPGVDIEVTDPEFDVEEITDGDEPDDGLAMVTLVGGEASVEVEGDELVGNLGSVVEDIVERRDTELEADDVREEIDASELGVAFAVVEEDGRWHPSVTFTIAELARQSAGDLDEPDFGEGVEPAGADSPEAAVQALLGAGVGLDAEAAIAILDPGEGRALHVYSQYFLPVDAERTEDVSIEAELTDAEVDDLGGGARRVVPTGLEVRAEIEGGTVEVVLDDGCARIDVQPPPEDGEPFETEVCAGDDPADLELPEELGEVEISDELREVAEAFQPLRFGIVTVERDGEHFVAPVRTLADVLLGVTLGLEPEDLEEGGAVRALLAGELDDDVEALFEGAFESSFGFEEFEDLEDFDFDDFEDDGSDDECVGVGCGFEDEPERSRVPTGASGANGELLPGDVVEVSVPEDGSATFTAVSPGLESFLVGVQGFDGFDATVRVLDAATGEELAFNDDFNDRDPEVLVTLAEGQAITIVVEGFAGDGGEALLYVELF